MQRIFVSMLLFLFLCLVTTTSSAQEQQLTLMGLISQWRYPKSKISGAQMADGKTVDSRGNRTVQSVVCRTVMTTPDSVDKVIEYYKSKLEPAKKPAPKKAEVKAESGRSVTFFDDSKGRPFAMQVVTVHTNRSSTTLVITRGEKESKTHIAWKYYRRFQDPD